MQKHLKEPEQKPATAPQGDDGGFLQDIRFFHLILVGLALICLLWAKGWDSDTTNMFLWPRQVWAGLIREFGFAFLIAAAISLTVEVAAKREYQRQVNQYTAAINRDVFAALFGVYQPRAVVDDVVRLMLEPKFMRRNCRIEYRFEVFKRKDGSLEPYVALHIKRFWTSYNTTQQKQTLLIATKTCDPIFPGRPADTIDAFYVDGKRIEGKFEETQKGGARERIDHQLAYSHSEEVEPNGKREIVLECTYYRDLDDNEFSYALMPSEDLTVSIRANQDIKGFGITGIHHRELQTVSKNLATDEFEYKLVGPVLPYQGVYLWWRCSGPVCEGMPRPAE